MARVRSLRPVEAMVMNREREKVQENTIKHLSDTRVLLNRANWENRTARNQIKRQSQVRFF